MPNFKRGENLMDGYEKLNDGRLVYHYEKSEEKNQFYNKQTITVISIDKIRLSSEVEYFIVFRFASSGINAYLLHVIISPS